MPSFFIKDLTFGDLVDCCLTGDARLIPTTNTRVNTVNEMTGTSSFGTGSLIKLNAHPQTICPVRKIKNAIEIGE